MPRTQATMDRLVEAGEVVSNAPFRERVEFLQAHDPEFSVNTLCARMAEEGYPKFMKRGPGRTPNSPIRWHGDTTHLMRLLGMRDQAPSRKNGKFSRPQRTRYIPYDLACALCRALGMWPTDCGV